MKKTKILSAFLSLTLSMTSFGAVPATVSAADTEISVPTLNPTTVGATTTTTAPPPVTTTSVAVNEAEEGKLTAVINIYDDETYEEIKGLHVQFVEYEHDWNNNEEIPEIVRVIADWNTNDTSQMVIENIDSVAGHFYAVKIDEFPEGYCYSWKDHCIHGIHLPFGGTLTGVNKYDVGISHHPPLPTVEYPLDINRDFTFSIIDESTNEIVEGLDVELAWMTFDPEVVNNFIYVETLDTWNTSEDPVHSVNIPMHFDSYDSSSYLWGIKVKNMPEGYTYRQPEYDGYYIDGGYGIGEYRYDLYSEKDVHEYAYYIKPDGYTEKYTTTMTTTPLNTTFTTTAVPDPSVVTTTKDTVPEDEQLIDKEVNLKVSVKDIDSDEYVGGAKIYIGKRILGEPQTIKTFIQGCEPTESKITVDTYQGESNEDYYVSIGDIPLGYELVNEDFNKNTFRIKNDSPDTFEFEFHVRKLAPNATPDIGLSSTDNKMFFRVYITDNREYQPVKDIDMKLVKVMKGSEEEVVLETWNTTDDPLHYTNIYDRDPNAYRYIITSEKLPDFYRQGVERDHILMVYEKVSNENQKGKLYHAELHLNKYEKDLPEFPLKTDAEYELTIKDYYTGELFDDLDVTVNKIDKNNNVVKELVHRESGKSQYTFVLPVEFEDIYASERIQIKINNVPDGYELPGNGDGIETISAYYYTLNYSLDKLDEPLSIVYILRNPNSTNTTTGHYVTGTRTTTTKPIYTTTTATATYPPVTTTKATGTSSEPVKGDANCDGELSMGDAVLIMQSIANPDKYGLNGTDKNHMTEQGRKNADIAGENDGITGADALAIQKKLLKLD